ncbi:MAG: 2-hydroxyacyl-CoA dehydratase [Theionarchaea archaeon]|nr:2-hydroxyacyl-CoA dehydratase [Theionarchaea archaeon]
MKSTLVSIDPQKYVAEKKKETKIFAHFCSYTPEEIIHAAGILPVRIFGSDIVEKANTHLQSYCCSYAKRVLENGLINQYGGSVFVHSCDTMQRLSDIWEEAIPEQFHDTIVFPIAMDRGLVYLVKELQRFKTDLETYAGIIPEDNLRNSIAVYNENRELLQKLYEKRKEGHIPAVVIDKVMKTSMVMEKVEHTELLKEFLEEVELQESSNPRLLIAGSVIIDPEILNTIEEYGSIRYDDLCTGSRYLESVKDASLEGIAQKYHHMWCPCRAAKDSRADYLTGKCKDYSIQGVVLLLQKFCEPHFFEAVYTKNQLKEKGYPCLLLELQDQPLEQLRTRIQAFCEILEG